MFERGAQPSGPGGSHYCDSDSRIAVPRLPSLPPSILAESTARSPEPTRAYSLGGFPIGGIAFPTDHLGPERIPRRNAPPFRRFSPATATQLSSSLACRRHCLNRRQKTVRFDNGFTLCYHETIHGN